MDSQNRTIHIHTDKANNVEMNENIKIVRNFEIAAKFSEYADDLSMDTAAHPVVDTGVDIIKIVAGDKKVKQ